MDVLCCGCCPFRNTKQTGQWKADDVAYLITDSRGSIFNYTMVRFDNAKGEVEMTMSGTTPEGPAYGRIVTTTSSSTQNVTKGPNKMKFVYAKQ